MKRPSVFVVAALLAVIALATYLWVLPAIYGDHNKPTGIQAGVVETEDPEAPVYAPPFVTESSGDPLEDEYAAHLDASEIVSSTAPTVIYDSRVSGGWINPSDEWRTYDVRYRVCWQKYPSEQRGTPCRLEERLYAVDGVTGVSLHPYSVGVKIAESYSWGEVQPEVFEVLCSYDESETENP